MADRPAPAESGTPTMIVDMRGIEKSFPGVHALRGVKFDLRAGEVHALMGENGAGKSTLMKILTGVYQPDQGEVLVKGQPVKMPTPRAAQDLGISIIHQELFLMEHLTAAPEHLHRPRATQDVWLVCGRRFHEQGSR